MAKVKTRLFSAGSILGKRYEIKKLIGSGGMGLVYLAHDLYQEKIPVALKVLHNELINEENYVERFKKEVALMRSINHPNVVKTYDFYESEDLIFFSMEYIEGLSLADIIEQKKFDIGMIPKLLNDLCEALVLIHSLGIIHRDIKPENILLDRNGAFRITDFGVARTKLSKLTAKNIKLGSVSFISPELWRGEKPSVASDLYAVGVLLYELTTGQMPFNETKLLELMKEHLEKVPTEPMILNAKVAPWLNTTIMKLLAKTARERYQNAGQLKKEIIERLGGVTGFNDILTNSANLAGGLIPQDLPCNEEKILSTAFKRQPTVLIKLTATHNLNEMDHFHRKKTIIIPLGKKDAVAFEFEFPTRDFIYLGVFLASLNIFDGVLTSYGVERFGIMAEGNTFLRGIMHEHGTDLALTMVKAVAICIVLFLTIAARKSNQIKDLIGFLSCIYLFAAILPWLYILFVRDFL